jgi:RNA recognition motif-containing protein
LLPDLRNVTRAYLIKDMTSHGNIQEGTTKAVQEQRVVHVGNLHFKSNRQEAAKMFKDHGLGDCILYWPDVPHQAEEHKGWCHAEYASRESAHRAMTALKGVSFRFRKVKTDLYPR